MVSLETSDGSDHCECEPCQQLGSISERAFGLANEAARAIAKEFPGKMVGMYAYNDHCEPPSFALEPNVYVQSTAGFIRGRYTFDELMEIWPQALPQPGLLRVFLRVAVGLRHAARRTRGQREIASASGCAKYAAWGRPASIARAATTGGCTAAATTWPTGCCGIPTADVDALLADFYEQAFGPAAAVMRAVLRAARSGQRSAAERAPAGTGVAGSGGSRRGSPRIARTCWLGWIT